jgi:hypothetical protein
MGDALSRQLVTGDTALDGPDGAHTHPCRDRKILKAPGTTGLPFGQELLTLFPSTGHGFPFWRWRRLRLRSRALTPRDGVHWHLQRYGDRQPHRLECNDFTPLNGAE